MKFKLGKNFSIVHSHLLFPDGNHALLLIYYVLGAGEATKFNAFTSVYLHEIKISLLDIELVIVQWCYAILYWNSKLFGWVLT